MFLDQLTFRVDLEAHSIVVVGRLRGALFNPCVWFQKIGGHF